MPPFRRLFSEMKLPVINITQNATLKIDKTNEPSKYNSGIADNVRKPMSQGIGPYVSQISAVVPLSNKPKIHPKRFPKCHTLTVEIYKVGTINTIATMPNNILNRMIDILCIAL